jgi:hypothetical protein
MVDPHEVTAAVSTAGAAVTPNATDAASAAVAPNAAISATAPDAAAGTSAIAPDTTTGSTIAPDADTTVIAAGAAIAESLCQSIRRGQRCRGSQCDAE